MSLYTTAMAQHPIVCSEKYQKVKGGGEPNTVTSCTWGKYKSIKKGEADYRGTYFFSYKLFKLTNNKYVQIKNSELFNEKKDNLLAIINERVQKDFDEYFNNPENKDCFDGISRPTVSFDNLEISFNDSGIDFSISFGLCRACLPVDGTTISFKIDDIKSYINN